ncbi:MAG TPA: hypothetical protein VML55_16590 [Planctomycetaceae bacterium]|nr:hypothetical protein [Planctomycetaceae bacterium]
MPLFDSDFLKKLEYLSLLSRRAFRGQLLAQRRTVQLGGGIECADHRDDTLGDDFRYLDWNLHRAGRPGPRRRRGLIRATPGAFTRRDDYRSVVAGPPSRIR